MKAKCVKCYRIWHVSIKRNTENYICPRCTAGIKKRAHDGNRERLGKYSK